MNNNHPQSKIRTYILLSILILLSAIAGIMFWFYQKGKAAADSAIVAAQSATPVADTASGSAAPEMKGNLSLPSKAVDGQDLTEAAPISGSVRSNYYQSDDKNFTSVEYFIKKNSSDVLDFYRKNMTDWNLTSSNEQTLSFNKDGMDLVVEIVDFDKVSAITQYSLNLSIENQAPAE